MNVTRADMSALRDRRILVVEDDPLIAMEIADLLAAQGAEPVGPTPTVRAALAALADGPLDLAVLDLNLRGECGTPVAAALHEAGVPFVLTSGYARAQIDEPELTRVPLVPKPVDHRLLLTTLVRLLAA
ncbi:response regulator [Jannaschia formosa]|uniref:response regulator n=1 Tax=Jannaschia formosa TaxID=2259592 RepID=UPI000E1B7434|nr:response regulator [Jannaschia formosa]TFL17272.1 response regulator [Jannaschia formosa]